MKAKQRFDSDTQLQKLKHNLRDVSAKYKQALSQVSKLEREIVAAQAIIPCKPVAIKPSTRKSSSEATAVVLLSDWHYEERVKLQETSGLNQFNLNIANERINHCFETIAKMVKIYGKDIPIHNLVIFLGGDFITGNIHEECVETAQLEPIVAIMEVQQRIADGIKYLLKELNCKFTIMCASGNHPRITKKQRHATEYGNSLETFMYHSLAQSFKTDKRVTFVIPEGYLGFLQVYDMKLCFHHGHAVKYGGGIGGIFIPAYKAISQWNKAFKADLHCFGHFHSLKDGGNFICNGSLIGYSAFAVSIKADYEKPKQVLFLIDKNRGRTLTAPIVL